MNEVQLVDFLTKISDKIGCSAIDMKAAFVKQAFVSGVFDIIWIFVVAALWVASFKTLKWLLSIKREGYNETNYSSMNEDLRFITTLLGFIFLIVLTVFSFGTFFGLPNTYAAFFNQEYWAINHILNAIASSK